MPTIVVNPAIGPRLHAFVIGVGHYGYVGMGSGNNEARRLLDDLKPLTAPVPSAVAIAEWLLSTSRGADDPPVGTVEVLISPTGTQSAEICAASGEPVTAAPATFANVRASFKRWERNCQSHPDNIALFYFCGHGWSSGEQFLLLEDVGYDPDRLLENCIDLSQMRAIMRRNPARTQLYLIDTCREVPDDLRNLQSAPGFLRDISYGFRREDPLDAPVIFSTAEGEPAFADEDSVTPYTAGLLRAMDGLGARVYAGDWTVTTESLAGHLRHVIAWNRSGDALQRMTVDGVAGASVLRSLDGPPTVPFRIEWTPASAPVPVEIQAHQLPSAGNSEEVCHVIKGSDGAMPAGGYRWSLEYPENSGYRGCDQYEHLDTPNTIVRIATEHA